MKERPILFNGEMVRAILEGRKTQTRRVAKDAIVAGEMAGAVLPAKISGWIAWWPGMEQGLNEFTKKAYDYGFECPYGKPGDRLWVREAFSRCACNDCLAQWPNQAKHPVTYRAGYVGCTGLVWNPSIHMPRWASRITLEVTEVRVKRVQEISAVDSIYEGLKEQCNAETGKHRYGIGEIWSYKSAIEGFHLLWDSINAKRGYGWDKNPWVWAITFKRVR